MGLWSYEATAANQHVFEDFNLVDLSQGRVPSFDLAAWFAQAKAWVGSLFGKVRAVFTPVTVEARSLAVEVPEGQVWKNYILVGGQRVAMREYTATTSEVYFLLSDHLGSASIVTNESGTLVSELRYSAYGEERFSEGDTPTDYRYTGQLSKMAEIGLYHYGARWFDPAISHFSQPDSLILDPYNPVDYDRYSYTRYNPINNTDPTGHCVYGATASNSFGINWGAACAGNTFAVPLPPTVAKISPAVVNLSSPTYGAYYANYNAAAYVPSSSGYTTGITVSSGSASASEIQLMMIEKQQHTGVVGNAKGGNTADPNSEPPDKWKPGDPINTRTKNGYPSWQTATKRYWINRAFNAQQGEFSPENISRMQKGLAPVHDVFGVPKELHHIDGRNGSDPHNINNLKEMWPWEHALIDRYRHYTGPRPE